MTSLATEQNARSVAEIATRAQRKQMPSETWKLKKWFNNSFTSANREELSKRRSNASGGSPKPPWSPYNIVTNSSNMKSRRCSSDAMLNITPVSPVAK
jgi:hypothetical protein